MERIVEQLCNFGAVGIVAAACLWQVFSMSKKLFSVIENNTRAITELSTLIKENLKR